MKRLIFAIVALIFGMCGLNAGEVQEFWCSDKSLYDCTNHFDKQCESKNYGACVAVGALHYEQKQYNKTKKYYEMVCDKANSKDSYQIELIDGRLGAKVPTIEAMKIACDDLASFYYNGLGVRQDYDKSLQYDKKACGLGNADACALVGDMYQSESTKKDLKLAKSYFEKSCKMESGLGCAALGTMYNNGEGVAQNLSKAKELFGKACDLGNQQACDIYKELNKKGVQ